MSNKCISTTSCLCFFVILFLCCCQNNQTDRWQKYYLSPRLSNESLVYHYRGTIDSRPTERFVVNKKEGDTLQHIYLNSQGRTDQVILEQVLPDGIQILKYTLVDGNHTTDASIKDKNVFSFVPLSYRQYLKIELQWVSPADSSYNKVIKLRRFRKDTTIQFNGEMISALIFDTREEITNTKGNTFTYNVIGREIYAERIGLFKELKHIENAYRLNFELKNILSPNEVEFYNE